MIDIRQEITAVIEATILVVAALFPIVNPLGSAAIFVNMVGPIAAATQRLLSRKIAIYSFFLLLGSLLWGVHVLTFFGIAIYAVQIGGGLVVAATGWSLLQQDTGLAKATAPNDDQILETAFYPFTLPITVGPGSISVAITLGAHLPQELHERSLFSPRVLIAAISGIILICAIIYICYRYARKAEALLGRSGTSVVMRLSSFILLCIGVQIIASGIKAYLEALGKM
ncbi:MAG TPA: MarC family protein [Acidobacteriaceae bacterium]|nr:MarC family protein [Acidobacteriaceae bacterium]